MRLFEAARHGIGVCIALLKVAVEIEKESRQIASFGPNNC